MEKHDKVKIDSNSPLASLSLDAEIKRIERLRLSHSTLSLDLIQVQLTSYFCNGSCFVQDGSLYLHSFGTNLVWRLKENNSHFSDSVVLSQIWEIVIRVFQVPALGLMAFPLAQQHWQWRSAAMPSASVVRVYVYSRYERRYQDATLVLHIRRTTAHEQ